VGGSRNYHLKRRYGLTSADVDAMVEAQGGTCATCPGRLEHVDHDHRTGRVCGILCSNCNQALGNARDDVTVLRNLIAYLSDHAVADTCERLAVTVGERSPAEVIFLDYLETHRAG
jgi:hypothetical protein